ncbi:hypothetical protein [Micromonospora sp. DT233]
MPATEPRCTDEPEVGGYDVWFQGDSSLIATVSTPLSAPVIAATPLKDP